MVKLLRQGDVLLKLIGKLPEGTKENEDNILAKGETTGHSHRIEGAKVYKNSNNQLLVQVEQKAKLVHEEHGPIQLEKGTYEVIRQREYNPLANRQVSD